MELSIFSTYPILFYEQGFYKSIDEALIETRKYGVKSAEVFTFEFENYPFKEYKEYLKRNDISLKTVIVTTSFTNDNEKNYRAETDKIKNYIDEAEASGAEFVMVVPDANNIKKLTDKIRVRDSIIKGMTEITEYAKGSGITVTMENFSLHTHPYSTAEEMLFIFKNVPGLKYTLDSGNFGCVKDDVLKAYDLLKDYIVNVHMKDFKEDEFGDIIRPELPVWDGCALGEGHIPLDKLIRKLKDDDYNGSLVLEINSSKLIPDDFVRSAEYLRRILNA